MGNKIVNDHKGMLVVCPDTTQTHCTLRTLPLNSEVALGFGTLKTRSGKLQCNSWGS